MRRLFSNPRHLLPLMIFMGVLIIGMRLDDIWTAATTGKIMSHAALAETKTAAPAAPVAEKKADPEPAEITAPHEEVDSSPAEMELLKQLSDRRDQLDKRAKDLDTHEAFLKVAEQRVDQKIKELEALRAQLQTMVNQVSEGQAVQVENLVKIYETMKPKEAARIFETMDMPTLLGVIQRMKPAKTAPIMAEMAPEKARDLTIALTKRDELPKIK